MKRVAGKVAIVTGAASGLGRGAAQRLAEQGATIVLADRDAALGEQAAAELGAPHAFRALDVRDADAWAALVDDTVARLGRLDVLVNAAGVAVWGDIERVTLDDWRFCNAVNSEGTFLGCQAAIRAMKTTGGGSIINLSSVAGLVADADAPAYCASKGAVRLLTKSVALHCARANYNIRCNSVHPSFIETPMVTNLIAASKDPEKMRGKLENAAPLRRMGDVDDIAHLVVYLASDESKFVTGAELVVDGGLTAR
jgi:NAD(P)-dependent dehydrogenase (short-subunit alcohol dehydrogenase family)|nr:glucose 1-dehydrogenase [Kofleriaceae bacterium]